MASRRERRAVDADLERLLDGDVVLLAVADDPRDHAVGRLGGVDARAVVHSSGIGLPCFGAGRPGRGRPGDADRPLTGLESRVPVGTVAERLRPRRTTPAQRDRPIVVDGEPVAVRIDDHDRPRDFVRAVVAHLDHGGLFRHGILAGGGTVNVIVLTLPWWARSESGTNRGGTSCARLQSITTDQACYGPLPRHPTGCDVTPPTDSRSALMPMKYARLTEPLVRDNGALRPASWDEALDRAAEGFRRQVEATARHVRDVRCSKATNEVNFLAQKLARVAIGTQQHRQL